MIKLLSEPTGDDYKRFIDFAALRSSSFSLIWNYEMALEESAKTIRALLKGHQVAEEIMQNKWLIDHDHAFPVLRKYLVDQESLRIIKDSPAMFACPAREIRATQRIDAARLPGLFSWVSPCLPENLTFYTESGGLWLESLSYEEVFFIYDNESVAELLEQFPHMRK